MSSSLLVSLIERLLHSSHCFASARALQGLAGPGWAGGNAPIVYWILDFPLDGDVWHLTPHLRPLPFLPFRVGHATPRSGAAAGSVCGVCGVVV